MKTSFFRPMQLAVILCLSCALRVQAIQGADVGLYHGEGAWPDGLTAVSNMMNWMGYSVEAFYPDDLNAGTQDFARLYRTIIFSGGWAGPYNTEITRQGKQRIRRFLLQGGGYLGICAGSYFACDIARWGGTNYDDAGGRYSLDLLPGTGTGAGVPDIAPWPDYNMTPIRFSQPSEILKGYKTTPFTEQILYYGGPAFIITGSIPVEVLATYDGPGAATGMPAVIAFPYGDGRICLFGPHPEIEEDDNRDGVTISREDTMDDAGSDWDWVRYIMRWLMTGPRNEVKQFAASDNNPWQLQWTGSTQKTALIQRSTDLINWSLVTSVWSGAAAHTVEVARAAGTAAFYRVQSSLAEMVYIPSNQFRMGDTFTEGDVDERPVHTNSLSPFLIDRYEVNNRHLCTVMQWAYDRGLVLSGGSSISNATGTRQRLLDLSGVNSITLSNGVFRIEAGKEYAPCVLVSWYGAQAFCHYRSLMEGLTPCVELTNWTCQLQNGGYRLPTEAEWECAARGGRDGSRYPWGDAIDGGCANYDASGDPHDGDLLPTTPGGYYDDLQALGDTRMTNGFGLYDMAGNAWEWCGDWYSNGYYAVSPTQDPTGPTTGSYRVLRGGSWFNATTFLRCAERLGTWTPAGISSTFGFRCVRRP